MDRDRAWGRYQSLSDFQEAVSVGAGARAGFLDHLSLPPVTHTPNYTVLPI